MNAARILVSFKTTAVVLILLLILLFLNVLIPQVNVVGKQALEEATTDRPLLDLVFNTLGFRHIPTSPVFLTLLGIFYLQLLIFLVRYAEKIRRRIQFSPVSWMSWRSMDRKAAREDLTGYLRKGGYRGHELTPEDTWYVRNRISPLGFLMFHVSFLLLLTGGIMIHYTRYQTRITLVKDRTITFSANSLKVILRKPMIKPPDGNFTLMMSRIEAVRERGEPVKLEADLTFGLWGASTRLTASINHPARFHGFGFYPETVHDALFFRVYDPKGFLLESVGIQTRGPDAPLPPVELPGDALLTYDPGLPDRCRIQSGKEEWTILLEEGSRLDLPSCSLHFQGKAPWVSFLVVYERGGTVLIIGFILAVIGLVFRFFFPRQDVIVSGSRLYFRGEYFPLHFEEILTNLEGPDHDSP